MQNQHNYSVDDIKVMEGLEAVRVRPGMYIGSTGSRGLHHMLWEIVDNAVDEAANGFATIVSVTINRDNSVVVEDNGRGIPVGIHEKQHVSGDEVVYTQLHAGGKFNNDSYGFSGGLHGVGASVVNALSEYVEVEVATGGKLYSIKFHSYEDSDGNMHSVIPVAPLAEVGRTRRQGTRVTFLPDKRVFETIEMNSEVVAKRLRELAYLNKGVTFKFTDNRLKDENKSREYKYDGGIVDFVCYLNSEKTPLYKEPIYFRGMRGTGKDAALGIQDGLKASGASGVICKGNGVQVVYGPKVAVIKAKLEDYLDSAPKDPGAAPSPAAAPAPAAKDTVLSACLNGTVVPLAEVKDEAFASGALGDGIAIEPIDGELVAPADGEISSTFETHHAVGMTTVDGAELLMHIGIDTVKLGGKHFTYLVNEGDKVKKGQPLIRFELEAIKAEGYPVTTPLIVCNTDDYAAVAAKASGTVKQGDALLELKH